MSFIQQIPQVFSNAFHAFLDYFTRALSNPALDNPYYAIIIISTVCFLIEISLPKKHNYPLVRRKGFVLDLVYLFFIDFVFWGVGFYAAICVVEFAFLSFLAQLGISHPQLLSVAALPEFFQVAFLFLTTDLLEYAGHWMLHEFDFLWAFHKIHHAQEELGFASTRHFHWFEFFVFKPLLYIPFSLIGYTAASFFVFQLWTGYFLTFLSHCNIKVKWGKISYYIITPETHYWHHAQNIPRRHGVNYASVLNIWDRMFGTFYLPKNKEPQLGIPDIKEVPETFIGQMIYPFTVLRKKSDQLRDLPPKPGKVHSRKQKG